MAETRQFRGISKRLAVQYLGNLGGERVDGGVEGAGDGDAAGEGDADGEDEAVRVEADGWSATVSAETVDAAGSIELTEVTVQFEGEDETLEPVVEAFARKAMRAGG